MRLPQTLHAGRRLISLIIAAILAVASGLLASGLFASDASANPVAGATLSVTPVHDLNDGDVVKVTGHGFRPSTRVLVMETIGLPRTGFPILHTGKKAVATDAKGRLNTSVKVRQSFANHDCTTTKCYISVLGMTGQNLPDLSQYRAVQISFGPGGNAGQQPNGPRLRVAPKTNLRENAEIVVHGRRFPAGTKLLVTQTVARPDNGRPTLARRPVEVTVDRAGAFTVPYTVHLKINAETSCATTECFIAAYPVDPRNSRAGDAWEAISFDGSDGTRLALDKTSVEQGDAVAVDIAGAHPLDRYDVEVLGPGDFTAQPHAFAGLDGTARVLLMSDFQQLPGGYTVKFTNHRTRQTTQIDFSVATNALYNAAQDSGEFIDTPTYIPEPEKETPVAIDQSGPRETKWTSPLVIVAGILALTLTGVLGWMSRRDWPKKS